MNQYRVAEQVRWAVEPRGVVLVNDGTGKVVTLDYPQAAIWDFLTRGESSARIQAMMCAIASLDEVSAQALVAETVAALREAGYLSFRDADG